MKYTTTSAGYQNHNLIDGEIEHAGDTFMFDLTENNQATCNLFRSGISPVALGTVGVQTTCYPVLSSCYLKRCWLLTGVIQGFRGWQRIGLTVQPRSLIIRGVINAPMSRLQQDSSGNMPSDTAHFFMRATYRIVVFRNMEPGGMTVPGGALSDLNIGWPQIFAEKAVLPPPILSGQELRTVGASYMETVGADFHSVTDFMKTTNGGKFQVVSDTVHTVDGDDPQKNFSLSIPIRGKNLRFGGPERANVRAGHYYITACCTTAGGLGGQGDFVSGAPFTVPNSDAGAVAPGPAAARELNPSISFQARLAYTDG